MHPLLPDFKEIRIYQQPGSVTAKQLGAIDQLLLILPKRIPSDLWDKLPEGRILKAAMRRRSADSVPALYARLANKKLTLVAGASLSADTSAFAQLTLARKLVASVTSEKAGNLGIAVLGFDADDAAKIAENLVAAALAGAFRLPAFKNDAPREKIRSIRILGLSEKLDLDRVRAEADGNNLARWLTAMPPNKLDATGYADLVRALAKDRGWQYKRYSVKELRKLGAGAFLAVAQGNADDSASILRLRYRPGKVTAKADLSLVGKGIIFDTGGTNLKPFQAMLEMHGDMQGSAVALGTLLALSQLQVPIAVDAWLAITENRTGPTAYKSQDLIVAANGKTIQTVHTDAEGRMALADTLTFASREAPGLIMDYATLTGSCINAITSRYCGVFTNRPEWHPRLKRTGQQSGERVWPFPVGKEFLEDLKSNVADLQQCSVKGTGDHILAGSFLGEFVEDDVPWIHMDLSAGNHKGGLGHVPTDITGFGVRYTISLVLDERILESAN